MRRSADQRLALRGPKPSNHTLTGESRFDDRDEIPFEERLRLFFAAIDRDGYGDKTVASRNAAPSQFALPGTSRNCAERFP
jgi:hypothetical protein